MRRSGAGRKRAADATDENQNAENQSSKPGRTPNRTRTVVQHELRLELLQHLPQPFLHGFHVRVVPGPLRERDVPTRGGFFMWEIIRAVRVEHEHAVVVLHDRRVPSPWWTSKSTINTLSTAPRCNTRFAVTARSFRMQNPDPCALCAWCVPPAVFIAIPHVNAEAQGSCPYER